MGLVWLVMLLLSGIGWYVSHKQKAQTSSQTPPHALLVRIRVTQLMSEETAVCPPVLYISMHRRIFPLHITQSTSGQESIEQIRPESSQHALLYILPIKEDSPLWVPSYINWWAPLKASPPSDDLGDALRIVCAINRIGKIATLIREHGMLHILWIYDGCKTHNSYYLNSDQSAFSGWSPRRNGLLAR